MGVKLVLMTLLLVVMKGVAGAKASSDGCIATKALLTSTLQDEMEMWVARNGIDVIVTVEHSTGRCELRFNDPALDNKWLLAKLILKDNIELIVNGTSMPSIRGCVRSLKRNTIKEVTVDNATHILPGCNEGPAIYQISKDLEDVFIPWHEEEARLLLEPEVDTQIRLLVGGQEFVVCSRGERVTAQQDARACTAGVGTSAITLIIPKSNKYIKVITADGKEAETLINNAAKDVPPTVKKTLITGTVTMKQCMAHCNTAEGCISKTALTKSTFEDEMDMWVCRYDKYVKVTVDHSEGSCEFHINDPAMDDKWLHAKLRLKDTIELFVDGIHYFPRSDCVYHLKMNTMKTVSVDNAVHILPDCHEGPAKYQINKDLGDLLIPWYGEEARLLLEPETDTQIEIEVGGQEFVVCSNGRRISAYQDANACTAGVGTSGTTLIIPKSNKYIKVITSDGKEAVTQITNAAAGVPPTVKKASITGTVTMQQCMPHCDNAEQIPEAGPAGIPDSDPAGIPDDCSCTGYMVAMVVFLVLSVVQAATLTYFVLRKQMCANACQRSPASNGDAHSPEEMPMTNHSDEPGTADEMMSNGQDLPGPV